MSCLNHWIPRPSFQTRLYHLGRLFQTRLYHLHPCRRASMQAGLRRNDGRASGWSVARHRSVGMMEEVYRNGNLLCSFFGVIPAKAGIQEGRCRDV